MVLNIILNEPIKISCKETEVETVIEELSTCLFSGNWTVKPKIQYNGDIDVFTIDNFK